MDTKGQAKGWGAVLLELDGALKGAAHPVPGPSAEAPAAAAISRLLDALQRAGFPLALATATAADQARPTVERLGLEAYFAVIAGPQRGGSGSGKAGAVDSAVRGLADLGYSTEEMVMVSDQEGEVAVADRWGIPCIAVRWGGGSDASAVTGTHDWSPPAPRVLPRIWGRRGAHWHGRQSRGVTGREPGVTWRGGRREPGRSPGARARAHRRRGRAQVRPGAQRAGRP